MLIFDGTKVQQMSKTNLSKNLVNFIMQGIYN